MDSLRNFYTKWRHWEYWPIGLLYTPIFCYYLWLSFKSRSFFYFSAANPSIDNGGMSGESKWDILKNIPTSLLPATVFVRRGSSLPEIENLMRDANIHYPIIAKPDVGERGIQVNKINDDRQLTAYVNAASNDFLIQEFIDYPVELGVFYYRIPNEESGKVTSVVIKEFLHVIGDGKSTVARLIQKSSRGRLHLKRLIEINSNWENKIPVAGEYMELEPIGNHCRGTKFVNGNELIDDRLNKVFDFISKQIPEFYFGRYDLKCKSIEELMTGKGIKIMELNGAGAEPSHIYDPGFSILNAYKILFHHWKIMYVISRENNRLGHRYMSIREGIQKIKSLRQLSRSRME